MSFSEDGGDNGSQMVGNDLERYGLPDVKDARCTACTMIKRALRKDVSLGELPLVTSLKMTPVDPARMVIDSVDDYDADFSCKTQGLGGSCRGHLIRKVNVVLPPARLLKDDEDMGVRSGWKTRVDTIGTDSYDHEAYVAAFGDFFKGKKGILRFKGAGCTPINSMRFVASPSNKERGTVYLPRSCFRKAVIMRIAASGMVYESSLRDQDFAILGRCPSIGADSALPVMVRQRTDEGSSILVSPDVCRANNLDYDGDKVWLLICASDSAVENARRRWLHTWSTRDDIPLVFEAAGQRSSLMVDRKCRGLDRMTPLTIPLDQMQAPKDDVYDVCMMKQASWKASSDLIFKSPVYQDFVPSNKEALARYNESKIEVPLAYNSMRKAVAVSTAVTVNAASRDHPRLMVRKRFKEEDSVPMKATDDMVVGTASVALCKVMDKMVQTGLDKAKKDVGRSLLSKNIEHSMVSTFLGSSPIIVSHGEALCATSGQRTVRRRFTPQRMDP